jgi:hypothetical protein
VTAVRKVLKIRVLTGVWKITPAGKSGVSKLGKWPGVLLVTIRARSSAPGSL